MCGLPLLAAGCRHVQRALHKAALAGLGRGAWLVGVCAVLLMAAGCEGAERGSRGSDKAVLVGVCGVLLMAAGCQGAERGSRGSYKAALARFGRGASLVGVCGVLLMAVGCQSAERESHKTALTGFGRVAVAEEQPLDQLCTDFGESRVCYTGAGDARRVPRPVPAGPLPVEGFRCGHSGGARVCEDRAANGGRIECGTTRCLQRSPRMPDDAEWECVEMSGVAFCHSRGPMAGVERGPRDLGWLCGPRRGPAAKSGEEICVDTDPDRPYAPAFKHYRQCRYEQQLGASVRSCAPGRTPIIGDACGPDTACPKDSRCRAGLCLPQRPEPACWLDLDCGEAARCALGSCVAADA